MPVQASKPDATRKGPAPSPEPAVPDAGRNRLALVFGLFVVAAVLLFWRQLQMMATLWLNDGALSVGALVPFVSAYFGWRAWQKSEDLPVKPAISGFFLAAGIALGVIAWNFGARNGVSLSLVLIPLFLAGCMASVAGWQYVRQFLFPLGFLWFLVPVPPPVLDVIDYPLQLVCARVVEVIGHVLHLPVMRSGTIVGPNFDIAADVAPECNGVRSSITLVMLTIIVTHVKNMRFLPAASLAVVAIPVAYAANFLRLCFLFLLMSGFGDRFMPYEHYTDLITGGLWFFLAVLVMISIAQRVNRASEREPVS